MQNMDDVRLLLRGQPPVTREALEEITSGVQFLTDFLRDQYFKDYIPAGGSKIKFITGRAGTGKTHLTRVLAEDARAEGFLTVSFSAREVWLHDFREIYLRILNECNLEQILHGCAETIMRDMGEDLDGWRINTAVIVLDDHDRTAAALL